MIEKQVDRLFVIVNIISSLLVLLGALFTILHYQRGFSILIMGLVLGFITSSLEISRLKKLNKNLKEQIRILEDKN